MHPLAQKVQEALQQLGASGQVMELDDSTATAAEAAATLGVDVAQIAKSLVFVASGAPTVGAPAAGEPVLVIASGRNRVSPAKLEALVGKAIERPDADTVKRLTGFPIGGVPPVAHLTPGIVVIDETLREYDELWAAAGTPRAVFRTDAAELQRLTGGRLADVKA